MAFTTINKSSLHMNTKLYTGNSSTQSITGVGFQPDFTWIKDRIGSSAVYSHYLFDAVRGATKWWKTNSTDAESTTTDTLTAFDSDGFSLGANAKTNASGDAIVSWNWKANGTGSTNDAGSIDSTVSVNTTSKFSIVKYTGTDGTETVGHGLGVAPTMIIFKCLDNGGKNSVVYHEALTNAGSIYLDEAGTSSTSYDYFADTSPTSTVFTVKKDGGYNETNNSGSNFIAYCFADVDGYQKMGSYEGNGETNGTFIYTGFKPNFVIIKNSASSSGWWQMQDNKRDTYNPYTHALFAQVSDAEYTGTNYNVDYLSNGFKIRSTNAGIGTSGEKYIYFAWGQTVVGTNNVPATAR